VNFNFRKTVAFLIIGCTLIFSGCGTTLTSSEDEKYEPVVKESTTQEDRSGESAKEVVVKEKKAPTIAPVDVKPATPVKVAPKEGTRG
jgi:micrococcal nuclease